MVQKFKDVLKQLLPQGQRLLLAVSGGVDSVVMAHLCNELGIDFGIAHCNFNLRGKESKRDKVFVRSLANTMDVPFHLMDIDTLDIQAKEGGSIQIIARETRYAFFEEIRTTHQYDYVATAHHLNDTLETSLYNLVKGTGLKGLTGIPETNGCIIRPMLVFTRKDIETYAETNHVPFRQDASNKEDKYARNKIRLNAIPILKEINPSLEKTFAQTQINLKESQVLLDFLMTQIKAEVLSIDEQTIQIDKTKLQTYPALRTVLFELLSPYHFNTGQVENILQMMEGQAGTQVISTSHRLINDRQYLLIEPIGKMAQTDEITISDFGIYTIGQQQWAFEKAELPVDMNVDFKKVHYLNKTAITFPLTVRKKREGDLFQPFGMKGQKTLKKFFSDEKYSLLDKENTWILESNERICAVLGDRISEHCRMQSNGDWVLRVALIVK